MSGGMEDGSAVNEIAVAVREAAHKLVDVLKRAEKGHRGLTFAYVPEVNAILEPHGYRLTRKPWTRPAHGYMPKCPGATKVEA